MVVSKVRGRFAAFVGTLELDEADLTQAVKAAVVVAA
jgi:polyisoprenoid-binding protein YceI